MSVITQHAPLPPKIMAWLQPGLYRHYSGKMYKVIGVGRHSESLEEYVIYQELYGEHGLWMRPLSMFCETIELDGKLVSRFSFVEPS